VFLGILSVDPSSWAEDITHQRERYECLRKKHLIDPRDSQSIEVELDKYNPLSQHEEVCTDVCSSYSCYHCCLLLFLLLFVVGDVVHLNLIVGD
jgi:hypothetical protein